ncbi:hypothetical protein [Clostridium niameyense]|uniref:hypothetical protein n=1 Tax=Clostridium niameyense TaxID=1622073 RepID=UPI00311A9B13
MHPFTYEGEETTYITFFEFLGQGEEFADDVEVETGHYIQVDLWSKTSYHNIVKNIKEMLTKVGFIRKSETELYEKETKTFHKVIRFFYVENKEEY